MTSSGGITLPTAVTLLFVGLKLGGAIDWSWWWVFSPLWICFLGAFALFVIAGIVVVIKALVLRRVGPRSSRRPLRRW
jgi:hypothetical protein